MMQAAPRDEWKACSSVTPEQVFGAPLTSYKVCDAFPPIIPEVLVDTGSLQSFAQRLTVAVNDHGIPTGSLMSVKVRRTGYNPDGTRFEIL